MQLNFKIGQLPVISKIITDVMVHLYFMNEHSCTCMCFNFSSIQGLCWSCDFPGSWCYLCVTQYQKVSIWRVEGNTPNLKLKLVRKISKNPLPQGSLSTLKYTQS